jgi:hypothetical protein
MQDITIGQIPAVKKILLFGFLPLKYIVFSAVAIALINKFVTFYFPHSE